MAQFTQLFKEIQDNSITPSKTTFCGNLSSLETTAKDNLVNAINELKNSSGGVTIDLLWSGDSQSDIIIPETAKDYPLLLVMGNPSDGNIVSHIYGIFPTNSGYNNENNGEFATLNGVCSTSMGAYGFYLKEIKYLKNENKIKFYSGVKYSFSGEGAANNYTFKVRKVYGIK